MGFVPTITLSDRVELNLDEPARGILNAVLLLALRDRATHVEFEPSPADEKWLIRYKVEGDWYDLVPCPLFAPISGEIRKLARLGRGRLPQSAGQRWLWRASDARQKRARLRVGDHSVDLDVVLSSSETETAEPMEAVDLHLSPSEPASEAAEVILKTVMESWERALEEDSRECFSLADGFPVISINGQTELQCERPARAIWIMVLLLAVKDRATEVEIEPSPTDQHWRLRYKLAGTWYDLVPPPLHVPLADEMRTLSRPGRARRLRHALLGGGVGRERHVILIVGGQAVSLVVTFSQAPLSSAGRSETVNVRLNDSPLAAEAVCRLRQATREYWPWPGQLRAQTEPAEPGS